MSRFRRELAQDNEYAPRIDVRYFYTSSLHIDDILAPVPPVSTASNPSRLPPQPFSEQDNSALDKAWNQLQCNIAQYHTHALKHESKRISQSRASTRSRGSPNRSYEENQGIHGTARSPLAHSEELNRGRASLEAGNSLLGSNLESLGQISASSSRSISRTTELPTTEGPRSSIDGGAGGTTGTPFIRAPSRSKLPQAWAQRSADEAHQALLDQSTAGDSISTELEDKQLDLPSSKVVVGAARLHHVSLPELQMEPIYWSPVHDVAETTRSTWFYKDTMLPVEANVANMLEAGYVALRPWTDTWNDELNSAVEVGAAGEEKIVHPLWPKAPKGDSSESRPSTAMASTDNKAEEDNPEKRMEEALKLASNVIAASTKSKDYDNRAAGKIMYGRDGTTRSYRTSSVIYANAREAYILRPSLQPSSYYGRRPLANYIRKGYKIGVCVVRGFDRSAWDALYSKGGKRLSLPQGAHDGPMAPRGPDYLSHQLPLSIALGKNITDLVLVIHGIGQKFSERVESFHFTHAMNAFRREVNIELNHPSVKSNLRKDMGGVMVLPVNWRHSLSFEQGGYRDEAEDASLNSFSLKDITPESLPSVRNVISDILLDIPYYLSHHQPKMIAAVVNEANNIYSLWCKNNPAFKKHGRVHLIAHSLGSVMAVDILSRQPTSVSHSMENSDKDATALGHFAFDTTNLFVCGSPAGFFLLLQKASLLPRRGRNKPSADGEDQMPGVASDQGRYGCIAVDNIYNIINPYDPVAYRLNATVDTTYAESLKPALIPSASGSWFSFGNPFKYRGAPQPRGASRPPITQRLPSNVELETHNFTQEEIAENRMYLLNDNGQIDYLLRYGGGPFEIQYLTMLGAHSSYWLSQDFVRFVVCETGRTPGRLGTLNALRALKKKPYVG